MSILRSFVAIRPMVIILCKSRFGCTKKKRQNEKFYQKCLQNKTFEKPCTTAQMRKQARLLNRYKKHNCSSKCLGIPRLFCVVLSRSDQWCSSYANHILKCFVLEHSFFETKHLRSFVRRLKCVNGLDFSVNSLEFHVYFAQFCRDPTNGDHLMQITFWVHQKEKAKREILSK